MLLLADHSGAGIPKDVSENRGQAEQEGREQRPFEPRLKWAQVQDHHHEWCGDAEQRVDGQYCYGGHHANRTPKLVDLRVEPDNFLLETDLPAEEVLLIPNGLVKTANCSAEATAPKNCRIGRARRSAPMTPTGGPWRR